MMFRPFSSFSVLFLHNDALKAWSMGSRGWLRALSNEEKRATEWRMVDARTPRLLENSLSADTIWVCGCDPSGIPVGIMGGAMRLPTHPEYSANGWLDPDGRFYPCGKNEHENLSEALHENGSKGLDGLGWARIVSGAPIVAERDHTTIGQGGWLRASRPVRLEMGRIAGFV